MEEEKKDSIETMIFPGHHGNAEGQDRKRHADRTSMSVQLWTG